MRKATAFRGGANKTAPPCETLSENKYFPTVPVEQLERKTFLKVLLLEKTVFNVRQKGGPPLFLPASVQQLPRCLVRICNLFHKGNQIANWKVSKKCNCSRENLLQNNLLRKCGLLAHTSAAFLKNCCTEKLLVACDLIYPPALLLMTILRHCFLNLSVYNQFRCFSCLLKRLLHGFLIALRKLPQNPIC